MSPSRGSILSQWSPAPPVAGGGTLERFVLLSPMCRKMCVGGWHGSARLGQAAGQEFAQEFVKSLQ